MSFAPFISPGLFHNENIMKTTLQASKGALVYRYEKESPNRKLTEMYDLDKIIGTMDPIGIVMSVSATGKSFNYAEFSKRISIPPLQCNVFNTSKVQYIFSQVPSVASWDNMELHTYNERDKL